MKNIAEELRVKHYLQVLETKMMDRREERLEISRALSDGGLNSDQRLRYEHRLSELGLEMATLWCDYRRLAKLAGYSLADYGLF